MPASHNWLPALASPIIDERTVLDEIVDAVIVPAVKEEDMVAIGVGDTTEERIGDNPVESAIDSDMEIIA